MFGSNLHCAVPDVFYLNTLGSLWLSSAMGSSLGDRLSGSRSLLILAVLARTPGYRVRRDHLAELFWPGSERKNGLRALRQALFYLSRFADVVDREDETLVLPTARLKVDVWEFDQALEQGRYERVIELYNGRFLEGYESRAGSDLEHWIEAENSRILAGLEVAYTNEIERATASADMENAVALARAYAQLNPLDHRGQWSLLRTLLTAGDHVGALRAYETYKTLASAELDEDPPEDMARSMALMRDELLKVSGPALAQQESSAPGVSGRTDVHIRSRRFRLLVIAVVASIVLLVVAAAVRLPPSRSQSPGGTLVGIDSRILVTVQRGSRPEVALVRIRGRDVGVQPSDRLGPTDLPSPDGRYVAYTDRTSDGWTVALREPSGGVRTLALNGDDAYPIAWSPDSRRLMFGTGQLQANGQRFTSQLLIFDLDDDTATTVSSRGSNAESVAAWAPDGSRIAFTADRDGEPEVFVMEADGTNVTNLSRHSTVDRDPAWSPDLQRIAFVSNRAGDTDLYTIRPDGTDLRQITTTTDIESQPVWLSQTVLAFLGQRDEDSDVWLADAFTGEVRQITTSGDVTGMIGLLDPPRMWVEHIAINPRLRIVSPGQFVDLDVEATDIAGRPVQSSGLPVRWSARPDSVATIDQEGKLRIARPGKATVVGSVGGWRIDSLQISSVEVSEVPLTPVFEEDWKQGINPERWLTFGDPAPRSEPVGSPDGHGVLMNLGNAMSESGVATTATFSLDQGFTIEVDGRMRFTGIPHQVFGIALYHDQPDDSLLAAGVTLPILELRVEGPTLSAAGRAVIATSDTRHELPIPDNVRFWRRYALQVRSDGGIEFIIDRVVYWRSPYRLDPDMLSSVHVVLGFQSLDSEITHGLVQVYEGTRYRLPELNPAVVPGERDGDPTEPSS